MKTLAEPQGLAEIVRRLRTLGPESGRLWGRMSAHQMICHLSDGCRMATGRKAVSVAGGRLPRALLKRMALSVPVRWPRGIPTRPEIDQVRGGTAPSDFASDVAELEALLTFMTRRESGVEWPSHPLFGTMSRADWLRWAYLHVDHHLRQFGV